MRKLNIKGCGKVKYQTVLRLTLRVSALLSINFVLKLDVLSFERVGGGIFQVAVVMLNKKVNSKSWLLAFIATRSGTLGRAMAPLG